MAGTTETMRGERRIVTTAQLQELIERGEYVVLPQAQIPDAARAHYSDEELARLTVPTQDNEIVDVSYVGREEVQCIRVDDSRHLYLTDDFIPTHNTANIVFLKSTDDSMIDTLVKMTGVTHKTFQSSVSVTTDVRKVGVQTDSKATRQMQLEERPVISYNDFVFLPMCNSIIVSAGKPPIWNRNATALPMSWAMFGGRGENSVIKPGHSYSLQTIPTLSSAKDFDVRLNQPNFFTMVQKRMSQALVASTAEGLFRTAYGFNDFEMSRLDPNLSSSEMMDINDVIVSRKLHDNAMAVQQQAANEAATGAAAEIYGEAPREPDGALPLDDVEAGVDGTKSSDDELIERAAAAMVSGATDDQENMAQVQRSQAQVKDGETKRYAERTVSREMLINTSSGAAIMQMADELAVAYHECKQHFGSDNGFTVEADNSLRLRSSGELLISAKSNDEDLAKMAAMAPDKSKRVHMSEEPDPLSFAAAAGYEVHAAMFMFLAKQESWSTIANGQFDREVARAVKKRES